MWKLTSLYFLNLICLLFWWHFHFSEMARIFWHQNSIGFWSYSFQLVCILASNVVVIAFESCFTEYVSTVIIDLAFTDLEYVRKFFIPKQCVLVLFGTFFPLKKPKKLTSHFFQFLIIKNHHKNILFSKKS